MISVERIYNLGCTRGTICRLALARLSRQLFVKHFHDNLLLAHGLQKYLIHTTIARATVNVLLNLIWIMRYAAAGSTWAVLLVGFSTTRGIVWEGLEIPVVLLSGVAAVIANHLPFPPGRAASGPNGALWRRNGYHPSH